MVLEQQSQNIRQVNQILSTLQAHMRLYGYQPIDVPVIEAADLFTTRAGDQVITRLFTFERHGQQLALRPEFTATAAYRYSQQSAEPVVRWQFGGPIFLDDPASLRPDYQQLSAGAELIGLNGAVADAEILSMAVTGLEAQQIADWRLILGHAGLTRSLLARFQLDSRTKRFLLHHIAVLQQQGKAYVLDQFDRSVLGTSLPQDGADNLTALDTEQMLQAVLDGTERGMTLGGRTRQDIARRLLQKRQRLTERDQVIAALDFLERYCAINAEATEALDALAGFVAGDDQAQTLFKSWRDTIQLLEVCGINLKQVTIQPYLARNWEYYTGIVFELYAGDRLDLGGGGRYDELVSLIGGQASVPAVGFAYNVDQLLHCIAEPDVAEVNPLSIALDGSNLQAAVRLAQRLRAQNIPVVLRTAAEVTPDTAILTVTAKGDSTFKGTSFRADGFDALAAAIRQANNDD